MDIRTWLESARRELAEAGIESAKLDSELLLAEVLGTSRPWLIVHDNDALDERIKKAADDLLRRRKKREPLAYLTGRKEFYGRDFIVTPDVLIPRPESEALVGLALACGLRPGDSVLDAGTGSGALGITIKLELPEAQVTLLDISEAALTVAKRNAKTHKASVSYKKQDVLGLRRTDHLPHAPFKLIIANLPYVDAAWERSAETEFEPPLALFSETHGLWHYINFFSAALHFLAADGYILIEADPRQHDELEKYAAKMNLELAVRDGFALLFSRIPRITEELGPMI